MAMPSDLPSGSANCHPIYGGGLQYEHRAKWPHTQYHPGVTYDLESLETLCTHYLT